MGFWIDRFPGLAELGPASRERLLTSARILNAPAATTVFGPGRSPENMLFLISGTVRVQQTSASGQEIVLYRIQAGQSCILTTACLLGNEDYSAEGISENNIEAVAVPRAVFDELMASSSTFRSFVFEAFSKRITEMFRVVDEVAFQRLDIRLANRLNALSGDNREVVVTHRQLAVELGTAREVVSRQLQEFQRRGWINQQRGRITISSSFPLSQK